MGEVKTYRIKGKYRKNKRDFIVTRYVRALDEEKALEKFYSLIGSEKLKRLQVDIIEIKEVSPDEIKNLKLKKLMVAEDPVLWVD